MRSWSVHLCVVPQEVDALDVLVLELGRGLLVPARSMHLRVVPQEDCLDFVRLWR